MMMVQIGHLMKKRMTISPRAKVKDLQTSQLQRTGLSRNLWEVMTIMVRLFKAVVIKETQLTVVIAHSSREAHAKQKVLAQERKAAKPNADSIARTKKIWERLRRKSHVPPAERKELTAELFGIITGRVKDFVFKHDSVRVIQTAIKYGNLDQRKMIAKELKGDYRALAESRYAKFLIGKLLVQGDDEIRDMVVPEFNGHVRRMLKHPEASWILDDVYRGIATPMQKATMLREWYGAEYALFKSEGLGPNSANLQQLLEKNPEKRSPIMHALHDLINQLVQKKTTGFTMLHDAMLQYFMNVQRGSEEASEFIELLKCDEQGDLLKNLAFTKSGARLVCLAFAYGTAKDRKNMLKVYKNTIQTLAFDAQGHKVLLAVFDVIDDTILISKSVFPELLGKETVLEGQLPDLLTAALDLNARIPLLYLFSGKARSILQEEDMAILGEIHEIRTMTSKKDPELRRKELLASLSPPVLTLISAQASDLIKTSFGCQFISEAVLGSVGDREPALEAIAALAKGNPEVQALLETPAAGRMLKTLVVGGRFNSTTKAIDLVDPPLNFHDQLYGVIEDDILEWATGSNSFVVVGLLEAEGFKKRETLKKALKKHRAELIKAANSSETKAAGSKGSKTTNVGNKGTKILLNKLDE